MFIKRTQKTDHERIAYLALSSKIHKDGKLRSNDVLMTSLTSAISNTTNANTEARNAKVESRLLSSKIIAAEAQEAVKGLRTVLESQNMVATADGGGVQNLNLNDGQERVKDEENEEQAETAKFTSSSVGGRGSGDRNEGEHALQEEVVDDDDDLVGDDGWESGSIDGIEHAKSGGVDGNEEGDEFSSPRQTAKQLSSLILEPLKSSNLAASSTFLPSLSVGYIKGDSDADADSSDDETAASGRKNRRGQRARQALVRLYLLGLCTDNV
jgi:BUD22